ncbi:MAG: hypothetical protein ACKVG0_14755, partial [Alphaproteobacteria bacterium]
MRLLGLIFWAVALILPASAVAQSWVEYASIEDRFHAVFPTEPTVEDVDWMSEDGSVVPGRRYAAAQGDNQYSLTVYYYRDSNLNNVRGS